MFCKMIPFTGLAVIALVLQSNASGLSEGLEPSEIWGGAACYTTMAQQYTCTNQQTACTTINCPRVGANCNFSRTIKNEDGWSDDCNGSQKTGSYTCSEQQIWCRVVQTCGICVQSGGSKKCNVSNSQEEGQQTDHTATGANCP